MPPLRICGHWPCNHHEYREPCGHVTLDSRLARSEIDNYRMHFSSWSARESPTLRATGIDDGEGCALHRCVLRIQRRGEEQERRNPPRHLRDLAHLVRRQRATKQRPARGTTAISSSPDSRRWYTPTPSPGHSPNRRRRSDRHPASCPRNRRAHHPASCRAPLRLPRMPPNSSGVYSRSITLPGPASSRRPCRHAPTRRSHPVRPLPAAVAAPRRA